MGQFGEIFLGILTAMGGFVEIGELTFTLNAGSRFGYQLLWVTLLGTIGIMVYCEMAGRIAAVKKRPVFSLIRERGGYGAALATLVASLAVNLLTCAAELGAVAWLWQLAAGGPFRVLVLLALVFFVLCVWLLPFQAIERVYGLGGLLMVVFIAAAIHLGPDWREVGAGFVPRLPKVEQPRDTLMYFYVAVALMSSIMLPYETYFYASGGIEDDWQPKDVKLNRIVVTLGFSLGALLSVALVGIGAEFFGPQGIEPQRAGSAALAAGSVFGPWALWAALAGMFFAFGGAAIETSLSSAYNLAQFAGWPWGKHRRKREVGRFTLTWVVWFALAALVVLSGVDPVTIVEWSIVFSVVVLPFTYLPVLLVARDRRVMGEHANGVLTNTLGWFYWVTISLAALAAIPLFVLTHGGRG